MSNSSMVAYTRISPNKTVMSNKVNRKITIHHMAGNLTIEQCGNVFAPSSRQASSNYGIGTDGRVGLYVEEKDRSWASSSRDNDSQAVTIEVANCSGSPDWKVSDAAYKSLIKLCVDICKRNGIKQLKWTGDASGTLTCHYMFASTSCPGPYLKGKMAQIAAEVNKQLSTPTVAEKPATTTLYRVRKTWADAASQKGAFSLLDGAKKCADSNPGYSVFDAAGNVIYPKLAQSAPVAKPTQAAAPVVKPAAPARKSVDVIADEVIAGKWGSGADRKAKLQAAGYDYSAVQNAVNAKLSGKSTTSTKKSVDTIAREVIAGKWGNGTTRTQKLKAAGYDPTEVQRRVNQLLK